MSAIRATVHCFDIFSMSWIGSLEHSACSFNDPVFGVAAMEISIPLRSYDIERLKAITQPNAVLLVAEVGGQYMFGGIPKKRVKDPKNPVVKISCSHLKGWFYTTYAESGSISTATDQYTLATGILSAALAKEGAPTISVVSPGLSGTTRDLTINAWDSYGDLLDSLGNRQAGFEWAVRFEPLNDGSSADLRAFAEIYAAGTPRSGSTLLFLDNTYSTNPISVGEMPEDNTNEATWVWALGDGQPPDQPFSYNSDPGIGDEDDPVLRIEKITSYSGVTSVETLTEHAIAERQRLSAPTQQVSIDHDPREPSVLVYRPGDRCRVKIEDEWNSIDVGGARIVDRAINVAAGQATIATVVVNLVDNVDPSAQE